MFSSFFVRLVLSLYAFRPFFVRCSSPWLVVCGDLRGVWVSGRLCLWGGSVPVSEVSLQEAWSLVVRGY